MRYYSIVRFRIRDFEQFKAELSAAGELLTKGGFKKTYMNRNVDNPNEIVVMHELGDLEKARRFYQLPEYKQCIARAGVVGQPEVVFLEELQPEKAHV